MSCFMVSYDCIDKILSFLETPGEPFAWSTDLIPSDTKTGIRLLKMNARACDMRYPKKGESGNVEYAKAYEYTYRKTTPIEAVKALMCFTYQCNEETVPRMKLYKMAERLEKSLAIKIISKMPEFEKAKWG